MPPKSVFRQPGAKHFQLVHRSQRDPLIHDPDASQHVLKEVERSNAKRGKSRAELENALPPSVLDRERPNVGEASLYGVYYDDTQYDYMQHLRQVGVDEEGVDSVLIEAPATSKPKNKDKGKAPITLKDLPAEALPSTSEIPRNYESHAAIQSSISGFRPDMDPHLRQALEALEDDAFVDDGLEDDFFGELVGEGERDENEEFEFEFDENGFAEQNGHMDDASQDESFEARFARFKKEHKAAPSDYGSDDGATEAGDTVSGLPKLPVIGGKRRHKGTSDASGYSMSSASIYRNDALVTLDERFDQIMVKEYGSDQEQEDDSDEDPDSDESNEAPELITSREDFESLMDDFLDNYEILGRKMKPVLAGDSGMEKLDTIRRAMGRDDRVKVNDDDEYDDDDKILMPFDADDKRDRWDCETILTTYSNLENHPRLIRAREPRNTPKIRLDPKTGLPSVVDQDAARRAHNRTPTQNQDANADDDRPIRQTVTRPRDETADEKKARKQAVKVERQARRVDKKATKEQFSTELKHQMKGIANKETKLRKL